MGILKVLLFSLILITPIFAEDNFVERFNREVELSAEDLIKVNSFAKNEFKQVTKEYNDIQLEMSKIFDELVQHDKEKLAELFNKYIEVSGVSEKEVDDYLAQLKSLMPFSVKNDEDSLELRRRLIKSENVKSDEIEIQKTAKKLEDASLSLELAAYLKTLTPFIGKEDADIFSGFSKDDEINLSLYSSVSIAQHINSYSLENLRKVKGELDRIEKIAKEQKTGIWFNLSMVQNFVLGFTSKLLEADILDKNNTEIQSITVAQVQRKYEHFQFIDIEFTMKLRSRLTSLNDRAKELKEISDILKKQWLKMVRKYVLRLEKTMRLAANYVLEPLGFEGEAEHFYNQAISAFDHNNLEAYLKLNKNEPELLASLYIYAYASLYRQIILLKLYRDNDIPDAESVEKAGVIIYKIVKTVREFIKSKNDPNLTKNIQLMEKMIFDAGYLKIEDYIDVTNPSP